MSEPATQSCKHCRRELPEHARFCPECGYTTRTAGGNLLKPIGLMLIVLGLMILILPSDDER